MPLIYRSVKPCRGNSASQPRTPLFRSSNLTFCSAGDRLEVQEQLHSPPGPCSAVWTANLHPLPNFPDEDLNQHSFGFDCGASSPGSIPSGASTEGSLSLPRVVMPNSEGSPSGQETPRADWRGQSDDNRTGTFNWEFNSNTSFEYSFNFDANDPFVNDPACVSVGSASLQFPSDYDPYNQDRLPTPGIEFSGPESIALSDRQVQNGSWAMNSLGSQPVEYATSSDTSTLFIPSNLGQWIDSSPFDIGYLDGAAFDQLLPRYPPHLDLPSESPQNNPTPDFEDTCDQDEMYLSVPQSASDSTIAQRGSPNLLGPSEQASSSGSNPRNSTSPDPRGSTQSQNTAISAIRWPSPESSDQSQIRDSGENHPRRGRRNGSLPFKKRMKISETRRIGACMFCALAKVECIGEKDGICLRCQKEHERLRLFPNFEICTRARLSDYTKILFPRPLKGHLGRAQVDQLIKVYDKCFTTNTIEAQFSCDRDYPPLILTLTEFVPPPGERATSPVIAGTAQEGFKYEQRLSATLALSKLEDNLQQKCLDHIKSMVRHHRDNEQVFPMRCSSEVSTRVFAAVCGFYRGTVTTGNPTLLDKAMMLYAGYRFMNTSVRFTQASFSVVKNCVRNPPVQNITSRVISRLLNRQLKYAVNDIMKYETWNLLEDLQKELNRKSKSAWATTFCVLLILCICMEEVQTAMGGLVIYSRENPDIVKADGEEAILVCRQLDDLPFAHMCELFHMVYKSHKVRDKGISKKKKKSDTAGFNPLSGEMIERNESDGIEQDAVDLVREIRSIMTEFDAQIKAASETPDFRSGAESLDSHLKFTARNSGRLIATFLRSFEPCI